MQNIPATKYVNKLKFDLKVRGFVSDYWGINEKKVYWVKIIKLQMTYKYGSNG